jgi:anti-sigma regulatory factor (Ser/Thr protein kinase)
MSSSALFSTVRDGNSISFTLASDIALVHPAIRLSEGFVQQCGIGDTSKISLVVRELLSNAVVHGNKDISTRSVTCRIECLRHGLFRIVVEDEGEGFDFESLDTSFPEDPRTITKRGFILIRRFCTTLEFNKRGNRVTVLIKGSDNNEQPTLCVLPSADDERGEEFGKTACA